MVDVIVLEDIAETVGTILGYEDMDNRDVRVDVFVCLDVRVGTTITLDSLRAFKSDLKPDQEYVMFPGEKEASISKEIHRIFSGLLK